MPPLGLYMDSDSQRTSDYTSVREDANPQSLEKKMGGRRERNRDSARKSRKRQTEKADQLHEELQNIEHANSALEKEIAALRQELHCYKAVLERHKPRCRLKESSSSLPVVASSSAALPSLSRPSNVPLQKSYPNTNIPNISKIKLISSEDTVTHSISQSSRPGMCSVNSSENLPLSSPSPKPNTSNSSTCLFPSTNPPLCSYSSTGLYPKTLFVKANPPLAIDRADKASNLLHLSSPIMTVVPCFGQEMSPLISSGSTDDVIQKTLPHTALAMTPRSAFGNTLLTKQIAVSDGSLLKKEAQLVLPEPSSEHGPSGPVSLSIPPYVPQSSSCPLPSLSVPLMHLDVPLAVPRQMLSVGHQNVTNSMPMLSLLSVPSPLPDLRMTFSDFDGLSGGMPMRDELKDPSFSELLERNDWLLDNISVKEDL